MSAMRILVVDDEADIRGLLKEILAEEGYAVEVAANAEAGPCGPGATDSRPGTAGYLDAGSRWHHAAARMVACPPQMVSRSS